MYFDSQFLRFQLMVSYCMALGPVRRQRITIADCSRGMCHLMVARKQRRERKRARVPRPFPRALSQ